MKDFDEIKYTDEVLQRAVELGKSNFIEIYVEQGYDQYSVGQTWHQLRVSKKGRELWDKLTNKKGTKENPGHLSYTSYEVTEKEFEENKQVRLNPLLKVKKQSKPKKNVGRLDQVRELYNEGITSASEIAKQIGANPSYVHRLLKQIKDG